MRSPAAEFGLAYSPRIGSDADRRIVRQILEACGQTDEVDAEGQIDLFTAMTGPVPGFVAFFADCMAQYAREKGIAPDIVDRAIRQLFLSADQMMNTGDPTPGQHVDDMIDYAGTTAAGILKMRGSAISRDVAEGLEAAVERARTIG